MATITYGADKNILIAPELAFTFGVIVGNSGIDADSDGRKIIKAGTPLYSTTNVLMNRQTVLTTSGSAEGSKCYGIILHDTDVTAGNTNATIVYSGYVDFLKLESAVQTAVTTALTAGGYEETKGWRITFIKGAK